MRIGVVSESGPRERRVALTPRAVPAVAGSGGEVLVARGAGSGAGFRDGDYAAAGASVVNPADAWSADVVVCVGPPRPDEVAPMARGAVLCGFLAPFTDGGLARALVGAGITGIAFEAMPRTTVAQSLDALSSQATVAGYAAAVLAAERLPKMFPMLTTAAGTVPPARILVLGAGVAGLQAMATARRLGGVVSGYDVRPEAAEQIASVGARVVDVPVVEESQVRDGYARELEEDAARAQRVALAEYVAGADVVIATAAVPGRSAPLLVEASTLQTMRPGSVVVDLAAANGGNCECTEPDREVDVDGITVLGPTDLPGAAARDASELYARNVAGVLDLVVAEGAVVIDLDAELPGDAVVVHDGVARHEVTRTLLEGS